MASTSGSMNGAVVDGGESVYVSWSLTSQSIANNTSTLAWKVGWNFSGYGCRGLRLGKAQIHGIVVYDDDDPGDGIHVFNASHDHRPKLQTASGNLVLTHNSAGALSFNLSAHMTGYNGHYSQGSSGTWTLPVIPQTWGAPSLPVISSITSTSAFVTFTDGVGGVGAIDYREVLYGTNPTSAQFVVTSDGSTAISGLSPGTLYYVWARDHNAAGNGALSPRASFTTSRVPDAPSTPVISNVKPTTVDVAWTPNGNGGSAITGYDVGYGTSPSSPTTTVAVSSSPVTITGLTPGTTYYFWVRAKNSVGNSAWSGVASTMSISGVRINVGGVQKLAVPYVRVAGVWKLSRPYVKSLGVWKETT